MSDSTVEMFAFNDRNEKERKTHVLPSFFALPQSSRTIRRLTFDLARF
jgi:hypothetical protein